VDGVPTTGGTRSTPGSALTEGPLEGFSLTESGMLARRMTEAGDATPGDRRAQRAWTVLSGGGPSDESLLVAFFGGESRAFGELVSRHQRLVQALVRRYAARPEDVADLAQASFLRAFSAARRSLARQGTSQPGLFRAWLVRIAVNVGKNHARDVGRWRFEDADVLLDAPSGGPDAVALLERAEQRRRVRTAMAGLSARQREVVTLRVDGGLPFKEVAQALRITENNAKVHFHHAVRRLKAAMEGEQE
jgi:RNA polymerase sigma-70 factor, ECF subfamily